jgi:uncharacterized metal-binding protein YceD (DUF177 family)
MKIHRNQIPDGGIRLEGVDHADYLDLPDDEAREAGPIRQLGPLRYALEVGIHGTGVWATGWVELDVEQTCVRCLRRFAMPVRVSNFAVQKEAHGREAIDLTPELREDILLALPANPDCHRHGGLTCKLPVSTNQFSVASRATTDPVDDANQGIAGPNPWSTLDELQITKAAEVHDQHKERTNSTRTKQTKNQVIGRTGAPKTKESGQKPKKRELRGDA